MFEEKKDQKDLQEICQKLLESCSEVAGASLEQKTWLSRNLVVKPGTQMDVPGDIDDGVTDHEAEDVLPTQQAIKPAATTMVATSGGGQQNYRAYSVQALVMLAELTATLLDVVYRSEEKDRVVPFLITVMQHVFPYLRNHSLHNLPSYRACSQMLASLSSYQYTRKAWKKEAFDLLLDPAFFHMDEAAVAYWKVVIDNLMTHDKITFRDLIARVTVAPSASLNLFTSKEAEYEQRAQLLKRLSFVIFCSEIDQYVKAMPDIQERLSDSLRLPSVPGLQAQVFLCFRVLALRMSPQHLTSLWPTIITELIHVLLQIEQELIPDVEDARTDDSKVVNAFKSTMARLTNLDPSWGTIGNGLGNAHINPSWLQLYLSACKLLDLALIMNTEDLPQFQLYRWAFVGDGGSEDDSGGGGSKPGRGRGGKDAELPNFVPHAVRINRLMNMRYGPGRVLRRVPGRPLLTQSSLRHVHDLHDFFNTISLTAQAADSFTHQDLLTVASSVPKSKSAPDFRQMDSNGSIVSGNNGGTNSTYKLHEEEVISARDYIEKMVELDFLESMQSGAGGAK